MISVKNVLADDIFGSWHVKQIIVNKDGKRFRFTPDDDNFCSKEEAELHAHDRARRFLQQKLGLANADVLCERGHSSKGESVLAKAVKLFHTTLCGSNATVPRTGRPVTSRILTWNFRQ